MADTTTHPRGGRSSKNARRTQPDVTSTPSRDRPGQPALRTRGLIALLALLVGAALAFATYALATSRPAQWTSEPQLLVSPAANLDAAATTSFYEALSRGQITATAAQITGQRAVLDSVLDETGVDRTGVSVDVSVVPETTVLKVSVSAERADDAEQVAATLVEESVDQLEELIPSYSVTPLTDDVPSATRTGPTQAVVYAATAAAGAVGALAVYLVMTALWRGRRRRAERR